MIANRPPTPPPITSPIRFPVSGLPGAGGRRLLVKAALVMAAAAPLAALAQAGTAGAGTPGGGTTAAASGAVAAGDPASALPAGVVAVDDAWTRATVGAQRSTGAFMSLQSTQPMKLVGVESAAAQHVEIHEMALVDNIMRMRQVDAIELAPGKRVDLKPGGYHVMLIDLRQPVKTGDAIALTLIFEDGQGRRRTQAVSAKARPLTDSGSRNAANGSGHGGAHDDHGGHGDHGQNPAKAAPAR